MYRPARLAALLVSLTAAAAALAADRDGKFMVKGAGTAGCPRFLAAQQQKNAEFVSFAGWLDGYLTRVNERDTQTFDVAPWQGTELLLAAVSAECRRDPKSTFHAAAYRVVASLVPARLQQQSPPATATVDGRSVVLYAAVITRLQARLKQRGTYAGEPNGRYDAATVAAVKAFQREKQLPETGLPDQLTLANLL